MRTVNPETQQNRRAEFLLGAARAFRDKGFHKTSIPDIAKQAGLSPSLLYHYFDNKNAIVSALIGAEIERGIEKLNQILGENNDFSPLLSMQPAAFEALLSPCEHDIGIESWAELERNPQMRALLAQRREDWRGLLSERLRNSQSRGVARPDMDASAIAQSLDALFLGLRFSCRQLPPGGLGALLPATRLMVCVFLLPSSHRALSAP